MFRRGAGPEFLQAVRAHRGCAFADFNQDGRIDVVTSSLGDRPELWENVSPARQHLADPEAERDGEQPRRYRSGGPDRRSDESHDLRSVGYASSSHFGVHFGAGQRKEVERIEIRWPSGIRQTLRNVKTNQVLEVTEPSALNAAAASDARKR